MICLIKYNKSSLLSGWIHHAVSLKQRIHDYFNIMFWGFSLHLGIPPLQSSHYFTSRNVKDVCLIMEKYILYVAAYATISPASDVPEYLRDAKWIITVPTGFIGSHGPGPSAGAVMTTKVTNFSLKFIWLFVLSHHHQYGPQDLLRNWYNAHAWLHEHCRFLIITRRGNLDPNSY